MSKGKSEPSSTRSARGGDERAQDVRVVDEGVEVEPLEVAAGRCGAAGARVGADRPGVVGAADVGGQVAAAVRPRSVQARVAVQDPGEDQMGQRDGVLGGLADACWTGTTGPAARRACSRRGAGRPPRRSPRPAARRARRPGSDSSRPGAWLEISTPNSPCSRACSRAATARSGCCRGTRPSPFSRSGAADAVRRRRLVRQPAHLRRRSLVRPVVVVRRGRADQLHVHALRRPSRPDARATSVSWADPLAHHRPADGQRGRPVAAGVQRPRLGEARRAVDQRLDRGQQDVGVHIDRRPGTGQRSSWAGGRVAGGSHGRSLSMVDMRSTRPGTSASRTPSSCHCPICTEASTTGRAREMRRS